MKTFLKWVGLSLMTTFASISIAAPIAYIEKKDGSIDFVNSFVSVFDDGVYKVRVITDFKLNDDNKMRILTKAINLSDVHILEQVNGSHKLFSELHDHYGKDKLNQYYAVEATDGTVYETESNTAVYQYTASPGGWTTFPIMAPIPGVRMQSGHQMKYYNEQQQLTILDQTPIRIVLNDPKLINAKYKEYQQKIINDRKQAEKLEKDKVAFNNNFRKTMSVGTSTNCGPVIEIKGKMIKVYSPVKDYGNEHWIARDELFPQGYQCVFVNGRYGAP